jgi:DNA-binding transcriptional LysR family regulator
MYHDLDWDDARLFLAVVREGSLRAAGRTLGLSQPTMGRRLARFESTIGILPLFDRLPEGLRLTAAGEGLVPIAEAMETAARELKRRRGSTASAPANIRVSVGEWAGGFLARCLGDKECVRRLPKSIAIELVASDQTANLTRREADLAVRHGRPETGDLYVSRVGTIACASYTAAGTRSSLNAWITYLEEQAHYAVSRWIAAECQLSGGMIVARASSMSMQAAVARAGSGRVVLPCYFGDPDLDLMRGRGRIGELDAPHWLIVHRALRRAPAIREVMDWIRYAFDSRRGWLEGAGYRRPAS